MNKVKEIIKFEATIVQNSSLIVSGSETSYKYIDSFFARDGLNRLTIPGSSIAGSIVSFARKMGVDFNNFEEFTSKYSNKEEQFMSRMKVFNSHPIEETKTEIRQMNGLLQKTRATAEEKKALFNIETAPKDTKWNLNIEIEIYENNSGKKTAAIVADVLQFWEKKFGFLGGLTSRGMGWITLLNLKVFKASVPNWNSFKEIDIKDLKSDKLIKNNPLKIKEYSGTINVGKKENGYGIDSLFVGGSELEPFDFEKDRKNVFLKPEGLNFEDFLLGNNNHGLKGADTFFITSHYDNGKHPFIPGSSLKGAIRHALSRIERINGETIVDPNLKEPDFSEDNSNLSKMFGFASKDKTALDSTILIKDCYLTDTQNYKMAMLEHHAEDEFTQGTYGSSKFNEVALFEGTFEFRILLLEDNSNDPFKIDFSEKIKLFEKIKTEMEKGNMSLGGKVFRGHGWLKFDFQEEKEYKFGEVE